MKHNLGPLRPSARAYVLGIILLGIAIAVYSVSDLVRHPVGLQWLILVALTVGSGMAMLRIPAMPISFSISDTFNIAAAFALRTIGGRRYCGARWPDADLPHGEHPPLDRPGPLQHV